MPFRMQQATWDEQVSEGKSLSEREEAVLQALELLGRNTDEVVWVKGTDLREKTRSLLRRWVTPSRLGTS